MRWRHRQAIPTVISMFFFWPVLITQIWGLVEQSNLDDKALEIAEEVARTTPVATHSFQSSPENSAPTAATPSPAARNSARSVGINYNYHAYTMERIYNINNSTLKVVFGDITTSQTDVIVSSDDAFLSMGGGVSGAIRRAASEDIFIDTYKHQTAALGDVVVTSAVKLPHKYVFHAITISKDKRPFRTYGKADENQDVQRFIIRHSVDRCCSLVTALGLSSIAFPAIGAGSAGIPYTIVAKEMAYALANNLFKTNQRLNVELYLMDRYGKMTDMDFIVFFEQIALSVHDAEIKYANSLKEDECADDMDCKPSNDILFEVNLEDKKKREVFVSYSRKDIELVLPICRALQQRGINVWIDIDGKYHGKDFKAVIVEAIENASVVLFFSSAASNSSYYAQQEVAIAVAEKKRIMPIMLDNSKFAKNIYFDLCNKDWRDYRNPSPDSLRDLIDDIIGNLNLE